MTHIFMKEKQLWLKGLAENPGEYLKRQREMRGVSLEDIFKVTRINIRLLNALERDDYGNLPHPAFVKGFIRAYCKCAGIDADDAVLHYEEFLKSEKEKEAEGKRLEEKGRQSNDESLQHGISKHGKTYTLPSKTFIAAVSIILFLTISLIGYTFYSSRLMTGGDPPQSTEIQKSFIDPAPQTTDISPVVEDYNKEPEKTGEIIEPQNDVVDPVNKSPFIPDKGLSLNSKVSNAAREDGKNMPLSLVVSAHKTTWIRVGVDNEKPFEVSLRDGESITWEAKERFLLIIGNAGGVDLIFNGKQIGKLGEKGQVVRLVLPQDKINN